MLPMIQEADELQGQVNDDKIAVTLGQTSYWIDKCLRNKLSEQKSDQSELELINTSSSNNEQLNLIRRISSLCKTDD
jgi:pectate lyase